MDSARNELMPAGDSHFASQMPERELRQDVLPSSVASTLAAVRDLAQKLDSLHQQHLLHLRISFQTATWNDQGQLLLPPPQDVATFGGEAIDEELCPLALRTPDPLRIPHATSRRAAGAGRSPADISAGGD